MARGRGRPPKIRASSDSSYSADFIDTVLNHNSGNVPGTHFSSPSPSSSLNDLIVDATISSAPRKSCVTNSGTTVPINNVGIPIPESSVLEMGSPINGVNEELDGTSVDSEGKGEVQVEVSVLPPVLPLPTESAEMHQECCKKDRVFDPQIALKRGQSPKSLPGNQIMIANRFSALNVDMAFSTDDVQRETSCPLPCVLGGSSVIHLEANTLFDETVRHPECNKVADMVDTQIALKRVSIVSPRKLEVEVDIKSSGDVFHELLKMDPHHMSNIVPNQIHACHLHEGEFGQIGSIIEWNYTIEGKKCFTKEVIEAIDEEKKIIKFRVIEGDYFTDYKNMLISVHVIPKGDIDAILWEIEFERFDDHGPYPTNLMDYFISVTRDVEAHHLNA
ncbi:hypothetical protein KSS87_004875 [Heliosperma pusillum]|nr:hypothetical protein KSS87_004875 [Heliosperma pusillum]